MTTAGAMRLFVDGVGLLGPGLPSWAASQDVLTGRAPHAFALSVLPAPPRLPTAERRRAGPVIRLAMAVAEEAVAHAGADPSTLPTVFASSGGEGANCHSLCETLASANPLISPTRFTNSVHNAAAGYWHIAVGSRAASTSLCAFDGSFGAGLVEAAALLRTAAEPLLLVAYDLPYPEPLNSVRPLVDNFGLALLLTPEATPRSIAGLRVGLPDGATAAAAAVPTTCSDGSLDALRRNLPAAAALPLLQALAHAAAVAAHARNGAPCEPAEATALTLAYLPHLRLSVDVHAVPWAGAGRPPMTAARATALDHAGIAGLIPHQGAMCLLDRLDRWDAERIACAATSHRDPSNPLRTAGGLLSPSAIEYAAQAMALHGALIARDAGGGTAATPGFLASVRGVRLHRLRLDDLDAELAVEAVRLAGDERQILYRFDVTHAGQAVADGRATVVLNTPLAGTA